MSHNRLRVKEEFLHQCWANQVFAQSLLRTEDGLSVQILNPGTLNKLDGPDFLNAAIRIGNLTHFGSVEIHLNSKDWFAHKHHTDKNYNKVVLHVVAENREASQVYTTNDYYPHTLNVFDHVVNANQLLLSRFGDIKEELPCSGLISSISSDVFEFQIEKAQKEYLDQKVSVFFQYYDLRLSLSKAWKNALFITLCDALGVPSNREPMKEIAKSIIGDSLLNELSDINKLESQQEWLRKGNRYITKPSNRISQAIMLYQFIESKKLDYFFSTTLEQIWSDLLSAIRLNRTSHNHRLFVSFFLPAMYALGINIHSQKLKKAIQNEWMNSEIEVPKSILKKFGIFNTVTSKNTMKRIGLVHQFNAYCKPQHCSRCKVLNKAISS